MSYSFSIRGARDDLWNPSNGPGRLFIAVVKHLTDSQEFADVPVGLEAWSGNGGGKWSGDDYYVEPEVFAGFIRAILAGSVARHSTYRELARGFLVVSLVILDRAGVVVEPLDESHRDFFDAKAEMTKTM